MSINPSESIKKGLERLSTLKGKNVTDDFRDNIVKMTWREYIVNQTED